MEVKWAFAVNDVQVARILEQKIADAARDPARELITYSEVVDGVTFHPSFKPGGHQIDIHAWDYPDRHLIGDYLGYICSRTFSMYGFWRAPWSSTRKTSVQASHSSI